MQLTELQSQHATWVEQNFPNHRVEDSIFGAVEELGELAHHFLKMRQGIRGTEEEHVEGILDSVADCVIFLAGVCDYFGADYGQLVQDTWDKVKQRNWVDNPVHGGGYV